MADFDFLFLVNTPGMYYQASSAQPRKRISTQARSHAAMAFHRRKHGAMQIKSFEPKTGTEGRALMPKPSTKSRVIQEEEVEVEDDNAFNTTSQRAVSIHDHSPRRWLETHLPLPSCPVDILPGVPHRDSPGFPAAAEFYSTVRPDLVHAPVFHVFDASNTFAKSYYDLMNHEVALHAGVAVVNMVRDVFFRSDSRNKKNNHNSPSAQVLRLIQVAISKLRQHMTTVQVEDPGGGGGGGRRRQRAVNDDGAIIAALFLGHIASGFGDLEAFQMHRLGIKTMIESRGGLEGLGLDGMLKCSVLQFESWWTHIYRDTSVFASSRLPYNPVYLTPPFSAETTSLLSRVPSGFHRLATQGKLATDIVTVLFNIASYQEAIHQNDPGGVARQMELVASLPARRRHADFSDACTCLLDPAPNFEKYLVFALICYASVVFSPDRHYLSASHTAFRTPRSLLTQDLPAFRLEESSSSREGNVPRDLGGESEEAADNDAATPATEMDCLVWMWLVLINSWTATDGLVSEDAMTLKMAFRGKFPDYYNWDRLDCVLGQFFWTEALKLEIETFWTAA